MSYRIAQSVTKRVELKAFLSSDHISPATGKTIAVVISKNGAAFGNPSAGATNATEIGNGWYYVDLSTTDTGTLGPLIVRGTEGTIDATEKSFSVELPLVTTTSALTEPAEDGGPPAANASWMAALSWLLALSVHELHQVGNPPTEQTLRKRGGGGDIAKAAITVVSGVSTTREEFEAP